MERWRAQRVAILVFLLIAPSMFAKGKPGRLVPDQKRQAEIRRALVEHGYKPGKTWPETQEILREIARVHHWPHKHAPDAKTLIFLGLGNRYSDPSILDLPSSRIEGETK